MYNRYIPQDSFQPVEGNKAEPAGERPPHTNSEGAPFQALFERLSGGKNTGGLGGILKSLKLDSLDRGDILLLLIILYLFWESDDTELLITLGLLFLMGL